METKAWLIILGSGENRDTKPFRTALSAKQWADDNLLGYEPYVIASSVYWSHNSKGFKRWLESTQEETNSE